MDRALKERIIGAIVLVVFIVLVVPVFLDGPAEGVDVVTETVALPGQNGQTGKRQTIVLERDRSEPVPAGRAEDAPAGGATAEPGPAAAGQLPPPPAPADDAAEEPADRPVDNTAAEDQRSVAAAPQQPAATESSTGMWAVQLGSFAQQANAERLAGELRDAGYAAFLSRHGNDGGTLHRVRIGPQKNRDSAEATAARLADDGHKGQVVPHP